MEKKIKLTNVSGGETSKTLSSGYEYSIIPPNGGWGWFVCFSTFLISGCMDGILYSYGLFINDFATDFNTKSSQVALANSICVGMHLIYAPFVCALTNTMGFRPVVVMGGVVSCSALVGCAYVKSITYIQILYGLVNSMGFSLIYMPSVLAVAFYFDKYRPIAMALAVTGTGVGSFTIPPICSILLKDYSWRVKFQMFGASLFAVSLFGLSFKPIAPRLVKTQDGYDKPSSQTMITFVEEEMMFGDLTTDNSLDLVGGITTSRISFWSNQGGVMSVTSFDEETFKFRKCVCTCSCIRRRQRKSRDSEKIRRYSECCPKAKKTIERMFDLSLLKISSFTLLVISGFLTYAGLFVPYTYIVEYSKSTGFDEQSASFLLSTIGVLNAIGRLITGFGTLIPNVKALLISIICLSTCGTVIVAIVLWDNFYYIFICSGIFGLSISCIASLRPIIAVDMVGLESLSNAYGLVVLFEGIASLVGLPLAGIINDMFEGYTITFIFGGTMIILSGLILLPIPSLIKYEKRRAVEREKKEKQRLQQYTKEKLAEINKPNSGKQRVKV